MGKNKPNRFAFTEAKIKALPTPATGRAWHYDTKAGGLCVCKTAAGSTSFYFYRRINGRPARLLLGKWPQLTVEQARTAAQAKMGQIAEGRDPGEEHRARRQQPTLENLFDHWLIYAKAHKKPSSVAGDEWLWKRYLSEQVVRMAAGVDQEDRRTGPPRNGRPGQWDLRRQQDVEPAEGHVQQGRRVGVSRPESGQGRQGVQGTVAGSVPAAPRAGRLLPGPPGRAPTVPRLLPAGAAHWGATRKPPGHAMGRRGPRRRILANPRDEGRDTRDGSARGSGRSWS